MKEIFAVLWIDDAGSVSPQRRDMEWYRRNAGPLSFAVERDDRFPEPLGRTLRDLSTEDYPSHHLHPVRWRGNPLLKRLYDSLRLYRRVLFILRLIPRGKHTKRLFRLTLVSRLILSGLAIYFLSYVSPILALSLTAFYLILLGILYLWFYVQRESNWECFISRPAEWQAFLLESKEAFRGAGIEYPAVVRHGWNLPPPDSMGFYLSEMGVLADASATPTRYEGTPQLGERKLTWNVTEPYYASLTGDYSMPWNGGEEDRGLLELPVNLGNIAGYGFGEEEKRLIHNTPPGGLVSCYIHPWDDFREIKEWVSFLKANYDVKFVTAEAYAKLFMRRYPRPALLTRELKIMWAFLGDGKLIGLREVDKETLSLELLGYGEDILLASLRVNTHSPLPLLGIEASHVKFLSNFLKLERVGGVFQVKGVYPGLYHLELVP